MRYMLRDKILPNNLPWMHDGLQYPANWIDLATTEQMEAIGIVIMPDSITDLKSAKLAQITQDRDTACFADVTVLDHSWQADIRSQQMLASAILLAQAGVYIPTVWRDANNVDVPITNVAQLVAIAGAMAAQTQAAYSDSWARKQALEAATTVEDVEGV